MSLYNWHPRTQEVLDAGNPGKNLRHETLKRLSLWMVGEESSNSTITDEMIFQELRSFIPDTDKKDKEFWDLINGAHRQHPDAFGNTNGNHFKSAYKNNSKPNIRIEEYQPADNEEEIPQRLKNTTATEFLNHLYSPDSNICITRKDQAGGLRIDLFCTVKEFVEEDRFQDGKGVWFCINELLEGRQSRKDADIKNFEYLLVELDEGTLEHQYHVLKNTGLPIAAMYCSGSKSIHILVLLNAKDLDEFRIRQDIVYSYLKKINLDPANKNPSRLSRLPGFKRDESKQYLIEWESGPSSFEEWQDEQDLESDLPPILTPEELDSIVYDPVLHIIKGLLKERSVMALTSGTKGRKTWVTIDLALSVSSGTEWLGFECNQCNVLYLNFELKPEEFKYRFDKIKLSKKIEKHNVSVLNLRGKARDIESLVNQTRNKIKKNNIKLVILDPMYKCLGKRDENSASDMNDFMNHLEHWCTEAGASVVFIGHFTKGDSTKKEGMDRQSGSGVLARSPDVVCNYIIDVEKSKAEQEDVCIMEFSGMREDAPINQFYMSWVFPKFIRMDGNVHQEIKKEQSLIEQEMMDVLHGLCGTTGECTTKEFHELYCEECTEVKYVTFRSRVARMKDSGMIVDNGLKTTYSRIKKSLDWVKSPKTGKWIRKPLVAEDE